MKQWEDTPTGNACNEYLTARRPPAARIDKLERLLVDSSAREDELQELLDASVAREEATKARLTALLARHAAVRDLLRRYKRECARCDQWRFWCSVVAGGLAAAVGALLNTGGG